MLEEIYNSTLYCNNILHFICREFQTFDRAKDVIVEDKVEERIVQVLSLLHHMSLIEAKSQIGIALKKL